MEERDLLTWRILGPLAVGSGAILWVTWSYLPVSLARDLLVLSPGILPLVLYKRFRRWRPALGFGFLAGLSNGLTRLTVLGKWGKLLGTAVISPGMARVVPNYAALRRLEATIETLLPAVLIGLIGLLMWAIARLVYGRLVIVPGPPACLQCGYCLTGNESNRCPECGKAVSTQLLGRQETTSRPSLL